MVVLLVVGQARYYVSKGLSRNQLSEEKYCKTGTGENTYSRPYLFSDKFTSLKIN